jgi:hypothetical protein
MMSVKITKQQSPDSVATLQGYNCDNGVNNKLLETKGDYL